MGSRSRPQLLRHGRRVGWGVRPWVGVQEVYMGGTGGSVASDSASTIIFELLYSPVVAVTLFYFYIFMLEGGKKERRESALSEAIKR